MHVEQEFIKKSSDDYKTVLNSHDDKELWNLIDWSGNISNSTTKEPPSIGEMSEFFTALYEPLENDGNINMLESHTYIPLTDDPITMEEMVTTSKQVKKGGFDYPREALQVILSSLSAAVLLLLNLIIYNSWPSKLQINQKLSVVYYQKWAICDCQQISEEFRCNHYLLTCLGESK